MGYAAAAWEKAMDVQAVILKALSGEIHRFRAAEILGMHPRSVRRWRDRHEQHGYHGLIDKRHQRPSQRRVPFAEVERIVRLYREQYPGFNVRHFHEIVHREHGVTLSYSYVKQALQTAGLVKKRRPRGRHRRRREPRACFGELLHLDGSTHPWLALVPAQRSCLIAVPDDATNRVLHAALYPSESTHAVMTALRDVFRTHGLPMAMYTDRASWAFYTPTAKGAVDKHRLTQVERALHRLGIEHIPAYSPQARGRSERLNRTFQDQLVNELRVARITTLEAANAYLIDVLGGANLDLILCHEEERVVAPDNTVTLGRQVLQIALQPGRRTCAGLRVVVRRHLDGGYTISRGPSPLAQYDAQGRPVDAAAPVDTRRRVPPAQNARGPQAPTGVTLTKADGSLVKRRRTDRGGIPVALQIRAVGRSTRTQDTR